MEQAVQHLYPMELSCKAVVSAGTVTKTWVYIHILESLSKTTKTKTNFRRERLGIAVFVVRFRTVANLV